MKYQKLLTITLIFFVAGCANETVRSFNGGSAEFEFGEAKWSIFLEDGMIDDGSPIIAYASLMFSSQLDFHSLKIKGLAFEDESKVTQFEASNVILSRSKATGEHGSKSKKWFHRFSEREIPFDNYSIHCAAVFLDEAGRETDTSFEFRGDILKKAVKQNSFISKF